jgi:hypothetical protein
MAAVRRSNGAQPIQGPGRSRVGFTNPRVVPCSSWHIGRVHRLLDRSLQPVRINLGRSVKTMHIQESYFVSTHEKTPILS